jgi:hypothetical protein
MTFSIMTFSIFASVEYGNAYCRYAERRDAECLAACLSVETRTSLCQSLRLPAFLTATTSAWAVGSPLWAQCYKNI